MLDFPKFHQKRHISFPQIPSKRTFFSGVGRQKIFWQKIRPQQTNDSLFTRREALENCLNKKYSTQDSSPNSIKNDRSRESKIPSKTTDQGNEKNFLTSDLSIQRTNIYCQKKKGHFL